jgi:hypothetical protein
MQLSIDELRSLHDTLARNTQAAAFYDRLPRSFMWGKQAHEVSTGIIGHAVDTRDLIHQMQRTALFGVNSDSDIKKAAIEWLVRKYESCGIDVDSLPREVEESPYSCPDICIDWGGRRLSIDFLRTVAIAHDIRRLIQRGGSPLPIVELGAGMGHLARTLRLMGVSRSHLILDLPETLIFSYAFLTMNFPEARILFIAGPGQARGLRATEYDFIFVPTCFAESIDFAGTELFVNTASLGEMKNQTIRYWMDFVQHRMPVKYLFTQNRFLNTIDPVLHSWRWGENEASVHYDSTWTILKWDLEPPWYQCPYVAPLSARSVDIAASREVPLQLGAAAERSVTLLEEVKQEDWFRLADTLPDMTVRQNRFVTDVTMTGALFKLWESIRLHPTAEGVWALLKYLEVLIHSDTLAFEETAYYQQLFLKLAETDERPEFQVYASALHRRNAYTPISSVVLAGGTPDYNVLSVDFSVVSASGASIQKKYYAIAKVLGPVDLLRERFPRSAKDPAPINLLREGLGERDLPELVWVGDSLETAIEKAKAARPVPTLEGSLDGYNIVKTHAGYIAVAQSVGPIDLFRERVGEKELAPILLKARTYEEIEQRIQSLEASVREVL